MQTLIKNVLVTIHELGLSDVAYFVIQILALILSHFFAAKFGKEMGLTTKRALIAVAMEVAVVYIEMALLCVVVDSIVPKHIPVLNSYYNNVGRTFVLVPVSAWAVSKIRKENFCKLCALYAFAQPMIWGLASLACLISGCCHGYKWEWGIYNIGWQTYVFPTQLLNAAGLVSIAIYMRHKIRARNYVVNGREYPIALILIGSLRFVTEFLMNNDKIILGLSSLSFDSLVMVLCGIAALLIMGCLKIRI